MRWLLGIALTLGACGAPTPASSDPAPSDPAPDAPAPTGSAG